jgi:ferrous iron transport protein B
MHVSAGSRTDAAPLTVALLGNPNTGKSTLFTALAGIPTRVGNYPGVTVEEKLGRFTHRGQSIDLIDLPGTYSLAAQSPDEQVAVDVLHGRMVGVPRPHGVVVVADATNLERNMFLATQAMELGLPLVIALTLSDVADRKGITIDGAELSRRLGCPVIRVAAPQGTGVAELRECLLAMAAPPRPLPLAAGPDGRPPRAREAIARYAAIEDLLKGVVGRAAQPRRSLEDRIDAVVTHRVWGTFVFVAVMLAMFAAIFRLAPPLMDLISAGMDGSRCSSPTCCRTARFVRSPSTGSWPAWAAASCSYRRSPCSSCSSPFSRDAAISRGRRSSWTGCSSAPA